LARATPVAVNFVHGCDAFEPRSGGRSACATWCSRPLTRYAATAEVIRYFDAVPVFVDVEPDTLEYGPALLVDTVEDV
jgi:hypothetical protein